MANMSHVLHTRTEVNLTASDAVWIATALLHIEHPDIQHFSSEQIVDRVVSEGLFTRDESTVRQHVAQHAVANMVASSVRTRMLFKTHSHFRRLFRPQDSFDPSRKGNTFGTRSTPAADKLPPKYVGLLKWYEGWTKGSTAQQQTLDPLLALYGSGRKLWADEHADEYVARLREGWE